MLKPSPLIAAIIMVCLSALCFTLNDTLTKFLIHRYDVTIIILIRSIIAIPMLMVMAVALGRTRVRWSPAFWLYAFRGAVGLLAAYIYISGLESLSVAEATVILFALPFIITAASVLLFKEKVTWRNWTAVIISFCGVIIAIQPGAQAFQPASLLILGSAFLYAVVSLSARWLPAGDNLWTVSFYGALFSGLFVAPLTIGKWTPLRIEDLLLFSGAAFCSSLGIGLASLAYRNAAASDLAPFGYSGLIWSTAVTWIIWHEMPHSATLIGAAVILGSSAFYLASRQGRARD